MTSAASEPLYKSAQALQKTFQTIRRKRFLGRQFINKELLAKNDKLLRKLKSPFNPVAVHTQWQLYRELTGHFSDLHNSLIHRRQNWLGKISAKSGDLTRVSKEFNHFEKHWARFSKRKKTFDLATFQAQHPRFSRIESGPIDALIDYDSSFKITPQALKDTKLGIHIYAERLSSLEMILEALAVFPHRFSLYITFEESLKLDSNFSSQTKAKLEKAKEVKLAVCEATALGSFAWVKTFRHEALKQSAFCHLSTVNDSNIDLYATLHQFFANAEIAHNAVSPLIHEKNVGLITVPYLSKVEDQGSSAETPLLSPSLREFLEKSRPSLLTRIPAYFDSPKNAAYWAHPNLLHRALDGQDGLVESLSEQDWLTYMGLLAHEARWAVKAHLISVPFDLTQFICGGRDYKQLIDRKLNQATASTKSHKTSAIKIAVCRGITGSYEPIMPLLNHEEGVDYWLFSDRELHHPELEPYQKRKVSYTDGDSRKVSRYIKTHLKELLEAEGKSYDYIVWIDANIVFTGHVGEYVQRLHQSGKDWGAVVHPARENYAEEMLICGRLNKAREEKLREQSAFYDSIPALKALPIFETGFTIFNAKSEATSKCFRAWWTQLDTYTLRDQISLPYALHTSQVQWLSMFELHQNFRNHPDFLLVAHNFSRAVHQYLLPKLGYKVTATTRSSAKGPDGETIHIGLVLGAIGKTGSFTGTSYIRLLQPIKRLCEADSSFKYSLFTDDEISSESADLSDVDVIYTLRNFLSLKSANHLVKVSTDLQIPLLYDIDDNLFIDSPNLKTNPEQIESMHVLLKHCSLVTCSTDPLAELLRKKVPNSTPVVVCDNYLDSQAWYEDQPLSLAPRLSDGKIKVLYMGTRSHDKDLKLVEAAARRIQAKYPHVEFHAIGGLQSPQDWIVDLPWQSPRYLDFAKAFVKVGANYDFAICPLQTDSQFNDYKSNIKYKDYSLAGLPAIYSNHQVYQQVIRDGDNGLIIENTEDAWFDAMEKLILQPERRFQMAERANKDVLSKFVISKTTCEQTAKWIRQAISSKRSSNLVLTSSSIKQLHYRNFEDIMGTIRKNLDRVPKDIDLIVGIPRSGMVPAYFLGYQLNVRVISVDEFIHSIEPTKGDRQIKHLPDHQLKVLFVDDSVNLGNSLNRITALLPTTYLGRPYSYSFLAIYASEAGQNLPCDYLELCPMPRMFQWNYKNHGLSKFSCYDIDGVLCEDPTDEQNDDGEKYCEFLLSTKPLFIPAYPIRALVTSRLEKFRALTEQWLKAHGVVYKELRMLDLPSKEERIRLKMHAKFKAQVYQEIDETFIFIESSAKQAKEIHDLTGKAVLCTEDDSFLPAKH